MPSCCKALCDAFCEKYYRNKDYLFYSILFYSKINVKGCLVVLWSFLVFKEELYNCIATGRKDLLWCSVLVKEILSFSKMWSHDLSLSQTRKTSLRKTVRDNGLVYHAPFPVSPINLNWFFFSLLKCFEDPRRPAGEFQNVQTFRI